MKRRTYQNLTSYMKAHGLNQTELADELGRSQAYISKLLNGLQQPSLEEAIRISEHCRIPVESLVIRESVMPEGK
jgi:transcriptional regulator with XRE-family HTH domain